MVQEPLTSARAVGTHFNQGGKTKTVMDISRRLVSERQNLTPAGKGEFHFYPGISSHSWPWFQTNQGFLSHSMQEPPEAVTMDLFSEGLPVEVTNYPT